MCDQVFLYFGKQAGKHIILQNEVGWINAVNYLCQLESSPRQFTSFLLLGKEAFYLKAKQSTEINTNYLRYTYLAIVNCC